MEEIIQDIPMEDLTPPLCECKKCVVQREIDTVSEQECTCTYKEVTRVDEEGNEYTVTEVDVKCDRCKQLDMLYEKLNKYDLLEKAYIDEDKWDECVIVDGVIYTPTEKRMISAIDILDRRVSSTEEALMGLMVDGMMI